MHGLTTTAADAAFTDERGIWRSENSALRYADGVMKNAEPHEWKPGVEKPVKPGSQQVGPVVAHGRRDSAFSGHGIAKRWEAEVAADDWGPAEPYTPTTPKDASNG